MLAGMYVVRDETPAQVTAMNGTTRGSAVYEPRTIYTLVKLGQPDLTIRLTNPLATEVPLLPACEDCGAKAGFPCASYEDRVEPMTVAGWVAEMFARAKGVTNV